MDGFATRYLGAGVSTDQLTAMVREDPPDLLVLSVTMTRHIRVLHQAALRVREAVGGRLALAIGGQAFAWDPAAVPGIGADIYGRDAHESVTEARRLLLPSVA
jgi:methanogenic corrinoid protein MtbC1